MSLCHVIATAKLLTEDNTPSSTVMSGIDIRPVLPPVCVLDTPT